MFARLLIFGLGGFIVKELLTPPRRRARTQSPGSGLTLDSPFTAAAGQITGRTGGEPDALDYVTQTSPQSEELQSIEFGGFVPTYSGQPSESVYGQSTGRVWNPVETQSLSERMQTRDSYPGQPGVSALEAIMSEIEAQEHFREDLAYEHWPEYAILHDWLLERGIVLPFLMGVPPLEWDQGRYEESFRDVKALEEGVGLALDPIIFTVNPTTALQEGRILVDADGIWWAVSRRGGKVVRERVPVAESWEYVPPEDTQQFRENPRWLVKGDSQKLLFSAWDTDPNGYRVWRKNTRALYPRILSGKMREYFYEWRT